MLSVQTRGPFRDYIITATKRAETSTNEPVTPLTSEHDSLETKVNQDSAILVSRAKFHEPTQRYYTVITDPSTNEVINEYPQKYVLDLEGKLKKMIGQFLDQRV